MSPFAFVAVADGSAVLGFFSFILVSRFFFSEVIHTIISFQAVGCWRWWRWWRLTKVDFFKKITKRRSDYGTDDSVWTSEDFDESREWPFSTGCLGLYNNDVTDVEVFFYHETIFCVQLGWENTPVPASPEAIGEVLDGTVLPLCWHIAGVKMSKAM